MPAFNVDKYIERSIESVICQKTGYSYLLTIINDGSTDRTLQIIESYKNYDNVEIINQNNRGAACARNRALEEIRGKYIMFLDSDDYLCESAIEELLKRAFSLDADIVEGSIYSLYNDKYYRRTGVHQDSGNKTENNLWGQPWGKVIRAELFENIQFPEKYYYEDTIYSYCIYPYYSRKYTISNFVCVYRKNMLGNSMTSKKEKKAIDTYWIMGYMWNRYGSEMVNMDGAQERTLRHMALCFNRTKKLEPKLQKRALYTCQRFI